MPVPPLDLPDPDRPRSSSIASAPAVRLFLDRAAAAQPGFHLTRTTRPAVALICRRLDGLPLAIELAAARVRVLPLTQIANRLDERFRLLTVGAGRPAAPADPARLPRLELRPARAAASAGSCAALAVFAGGWTLEAAEAVGGRRATTPRPWSSYWAGW